MTNGSKIFHAFFVYYWENAEVIPVLSNVLVQVDISSKHCII